MPHINMTYNHTYKRGIHFCNIYINPFIVDTERYRLPLIWKRNVLDMIFTNQPEAILGMNRFLYIYVIILLLRPIVTTPSQIPVHLCVPLFLCDHDVYFLKYVTLCVL